MASVGGYGKAQLLGSIGYNAYHGAVMMILLSLGFLEKVPKEYVCTYESDPGKEVICKPEEFCKDPTVLSFHPNMELHDSYINWISHYNLTCIDGAHIGMIGSCFFIGWILTLMFIPRLSDTNGRNKFIIVSNVIQTMAFFVVILRDRPELSMLLFVC